MGGKRAKPPDLPGGHQQKARWAEREEGAAESSGSLLAKLLLKKWSWGEISTPMLQEFAKAAYDDGIKHPQIKTLAALGSHGANPGNMHAELTRKLTPAPLCSAVSYHKVHMKKPSGFLTGATHPMLLPHQVFATMYNHHKQEFIRCFCGGDVQNVVKFWEAMSTHPMYQNHPIRAMTDHKSKAIPISLHGDDVPVAAIGKGKPKSASVYSWSGLLGKGSTKMLNFLIYVIYSHLVIRTPDMDVYAQFCKKMCWSLYWLAKGVWPERDENNRKIETPQAGTSLAGGYCAVVWLCKGDLDFMAKAYGLRHYASTQPCICCRANTEDADKPWTDIAPTARWRAHIWRNEDWWANHPNRHPVFRLPGVGVLAYFPDMMHTCHLGCWQWFFGSVLKYLVKYILPHGEQQNLDMVWSKVRSHYQDNLVGAWV